MPKNAGIWSSNKTGKATSAMRLYTRVVVPEFPMVNVQVRFASMGTQQAHQAQRARHRNGMAKMIRKSSPKTSSWIAYAISSEVIYRVIPAGDC